MLELVESKCRQHLKALRDLLSVADKDNTSFVPRKEFVAILRSVSGWLG